MFACFTTRPLERKENRPAPIRRRLKTRLSQKEYLSPWSKLVKESRARRRKPVFCTISAIAGAGTLVFKSKNNRVEPTSSNPLESQYVSSNTAIKLQACTRMWLNTLATSKQQVEECICVGSRARKIYTLYIYPACTKPSKSLENLIAIAPIVEESAYAITARPHLLCLSLGELKWI